MTGVYLTIQEAPEYSVTTVDNEISLTVVESTPITITLSEVGSIVTLTHHNDLLELNTGNYQHLTSAEKTLFDTITSGTDITGTELESLSDGSNADSLHEHTTSILTDFSTAVSDEMLSHTSDSTIHYFKTDIDHTQLMNIGSNSHDEIDTHISDNTIHFTVDSISHNDIDDIGVNSHLEIDNHIFHTNIHYLMSAISITHDQISDFDSGVSSSSDVASNTLLKHTHSNKAILDSTNEVFSTERNTRLTNAVTIDEDQVITGIKVFSQLPSTDTVLLPSSNTDFVTKSYVDSIVSIAENWESFTLSATDISNKYVEVSGIITDNQSIRLFIDNAGIKAEQGVDYSISGNQIFWTGYEFEGLIEAGDKLTVFYY